MNTSVVEKRNMKITSVPVHGFKTERLSTCRPFIKQLDIIFPTNAALEGALSTLETTYWKGKSRISEIVDKAGTYVNSVVQESQLLLVSTGANEDDTWCIDSRGVLSLVVSKDTYERLGLVGKKLPFKSHKEMHVVRISLYQNTESAPNRARRKAALELWDQTREEQGLGPWDILMCYNGPSSEAPVAILTEAGPDQRKVRCQKAELRDVHSPLPNLSPRPSEFEELDDWNHDMSELFEWTGMAALGAQRLRANDRVDPFVAVYEAPTPSQIGNVTHLQWKGLLSPTFVKRVIDKVFSTIQADGSFTSNPESTRSFVSIASHALTESPVCYIPLAALPGNGIENILDSTPTRLPRADGEDTYSLIVAPTAEGVRCTFVESLGRWDTRWG
ncbi:ribonuclease P 40kDa subunit-domain-containing protein [Cyathus striatus]|nr:ribonuclease P 40kDa subunit-domain-containing protein [Cyathus striatus]